MENKEIFDLKGQIAIVTGGGSGLGKEFALALARAGADVVIADILLAEAKNTAREVKAIGQRALVVKTDVTDPEKVKDMVNRTVNDFLKIDILVNNAGINIIAPAEEFSFSDWNKIVSINLTGVFLCAQMVGEQMIRQRKGKIINIASIFGLIG